MSLPNLQNSYYSGLSGLALPIPKYLFPEPYREASRLTYYASTFNSLEVNSSFYKIPRGVTVKKWAASVPDHFKFTFKLWKQITHVKGLLFEKNDVDLFLKSIAFAGDKKGCLLIQLPPSSKVFNAQQLDYLLYCIHEFIPQHGFSVAVEFRDKSWYQDSVYMMLESHGATIVIQDIPKSATPLLDLQADTIYVRFHGPTGNYRESYGDDILSEYAGYIADWINDEKSVYVYFNNTMGDAFKNLQTLNGMVFDIVL